MPTTTTDTLYAVLFETSGDATQYLIFPRPRGRAVILTRAIPGEWRTCKVLPDEAALLRRPVAVLVRDTDVEEYIDSGIPLGLIDRALISHRNSSTIGSTPRNLPQIEEMVAKADGSLAAWLVEPAVDIEHRPSFVPVVGDRMAYIPDAEIADRYIHRAIRGRTDFEVLEWALINRKNVLLYGPTGAGKTMLPEAFAASRGMHMAMVSGNVAMTTHQILGGLVGDGHGGWVWQDGIATEVVRNGGVLDLDELNFIPSKIATVLFPLLAGQRHITLLDNRGETIKAHPDLLIVATMNPGYAGTLELNAALRNRFTLQIDWGYDEHVEKILVPSKNLRLLARQLREEEAKERLHTPTPTNALMDFHLISEGLGFEWAIGNFLDRYADDEKSIVKMVIDTHRMKIESDFGQRDALPEADVPEDDYELNDPADALRSLASLKIT